jgi:hypothetical protein
MAEDRNKIEADGKKTYADELENYAQKTWLPREGVDGSESSQSLHSFLLSCARPVDPFPDAEKQQTQSYKKSKR